MLDTTGTGKEDARPHEGRIGDVGYLHRISAREMKSHHRKNVESSRGLSHNKLGSRIARIWRSKSCVVNGW